MHAFALPSGLWEEEAAATTLDAPGWPPAGERLAVSVPAAEWRAHAFLAGLSLARRAEVATRPRFYTMPWLRHADEPDADDLPL